MPLKGFLTIDKESDRVLSAKEFALHVKKSRDVIHVQQRGVHMLTN